MILGGSWEWALVYVLHEWLFTNPRINVIQYRRFLAHQRRHGRCNLDVRCLRHRNDFRYPVNGGNGLDVSYGNFSIIYTNVLFSEHTLTNIRAPTAGGQYHWVSEFAPRKYEKILSFATGQYCALHHAFIRPLGLHNGGKDQTA